MVKHLSCWRIGDIVRLFLVTASITAVPAAVSAQNNDQASIDGLITDQSGAVLPGVTVTASSASLQVRQVTAVTDSAGEYRLTALPIGTYDVIYSLDGFQSVRREAVRLTAGFTAKLDIVLRVGLLNETITVSGASPVVDVASSTPRTVLTRET